VLQVFKDFKSKLENRTGKRIKILFGDNAGEFVSEAFKTYLADVGITWQSTAPYSSEQNGVSERGHLTLMDSARSMLIHAKLPKQFWGPAVLTATHVHNVCPHPDKSSSTPHERLWGTMPDVSYLRVFGCDAYGLLRNNSKLDAKAKKYVFIGYAEYQKGYVLYDPDSGKSLVSRDVTFHEFCFGTREPQDALCDPAEPESKYDSDYSPSIDDFSYDSDITICNDDPISTSCYEQIENMAGEHSRISNRTRNSPKRLGNLVSNNWVRSIKVATTTSDIPTPKTYQEAKNDPFMVAAMKKELNSLHDRETFQERFNLPENARPISCVWVYKIKDVTALPDHHDWIVRTLDNGTVVRYKARLCVRGNHQRKGIDYTETYAPVMRGEILRLITTLLVEDSEIVAVQMDAITAFLNGQLKEEIYMHTPQGYKSRARYVKLLKSLYGLKQAPHEWHKVIDSYLIEIGFTKVQSTSCLYIRRTAQRFVLVGIYVDDFPIIGHPELVQETKSQLSSKFEMSDLGRLHNFIGVQLEYHSKKGIAFLHQTKSIDQILKLTNMEHSRPCATPSSSVKLTKDMSPRTNDDRISVQQEKTRIDFRSVVGSLLYLRFTRPDIAYALSQLCKFVQNPGQTHYVALKRLLRYLSGTRTLGLLYRRGPGSFMLEGYSDSDWAGDVDTRRSTTGFLFHINGNLISYSSKQQSLLSRSITLGTWFRQANCNQDSCRHHRISQIYSQNHCLRHLLLSCAMLSEC